MHVRRYRHRMCRQSLQARGFTLLELMITLAISSILLTSGLPAMQGMLQSSLHTSHVNTFVTHLHYSRSEAVKRGRNVVMCKSEDRQSCTDTDGWHLGWIIFTDTNKNREYDEGEHLLRIEQGWKDGIAVTSGQRRRVVYQPTGQSPGTNGTYVFCNDDYPELVRAVILSNSGRPRFSRKSPDGSPLECG